MATITKRHYEVTFILPPALGEEETNNLQNTVQGWITDQGGEIAKVNHWGRRRLAYPIKNYKEGYYILIEFDATPNIIKDLDRRLRLDTNFLRHLVIKPD